MSTILMLTHQNDVGLAPASHGDSPGSSVFDLPTGNQSTRRPNLTSIRQSQDASVHRPTSAPSFLVISGGTGGNAICSAFGDTTTYVLPVSDDGGSSSEIIRVLGGPSIGDIRSRLVRLIPSAPPGSPLDAIRRLLSHRLPAHGLEREAREEWREIVEGRGALWSGIPTDRKETIRGFLVSFESQLLKQAHKNFSFLNGSIGNYFLAAAQGFFGSLPSAIFLFSSITNSQANILPVIVTNRTVTIAAELNDGEKLVGQCEISHPVRVRVQTMQPLINIDAVPLSPVEDDGMARDVSRRQNVMFESRTKEQYVPLASRISRLYYINAYGQEVHPVPNADYLSSMSTHHVLVYSCGSLWTSIIPCLALQGIATAIACSRSIRAKVLLREHFFHLFRALNTLLEVNSKNDRETDGFTAVDYIEAITRTLNSQNHVQPYGLGNVNTTYPISAFITHLVYLQGAKVPVDADRITALGVRCVQVVSQGDEAEVPMFNAGNVRQALNELLEWDEW